MSSRPASAPNRRGGGGGGNKKGNEKRANNIAARYGIDANGNQQNGNGGSNFADAGPKMKNFGGSMSSTVRERVTDIEALEEQYFHAKKEFLKLEVSQGGLMHEVTDLENQEYRKDKLLLELLLASKVPPRWANEIDVVLGRRTKGSKASGKMGTKWNSRGGPNGHQRRASRCDLTPVAKAGRALILRPAFITRC